MEIDLDQVIYLSWGPCKINATILSTWIVMLLLLVLSWFITRNLSTGAKVSKKQAFLESLITAILRQIRDLNVEHPQKYLPFVGTLFLFIASANLLSLVPYFRPPTASLSSTAALATCVLAAVPAFGIRARGVKSYLYQYFQPTIFMLPFNLMGEITRTFALAIRLYGNMMSGMMIVGVFFAIVPLFLPIFMQVLGLITGMVQAYIFAILAMVYIASGLRAKQSDSDQKHHATGGKYG